MRVGRRRVHSFNAIDQCSPNFLYKFVTNNVYLQQSKPLNTTKGTYESYDALYILSYAFHLNFS